MSKLKRGFENYVGFTREEKEAKCRAFFEELTRALEGLCYAAVGSCNRDATMYLVPSGMENQITYTGKPMSSFRISDHWNWKSSLEKNPHEGYVQCFTRDLPSFRNRREPGKASMPIWAWQVCYFGPDEQYHCVFGEKFNRKLKIWEWVETDIPTLIQQIRKDRMTEEVA